MEKHGTGKVKLIQQAGVIPYRFRRSKLEILLITSSRSGRWVVPKGHIEPDMTPRQSAITEAFEEAGINGKVPKTSFGTYSYEKADDKCGQSYRVEIFAMRVTYVMKNWPEEFRRTRTWMSPKEASDSVRENELKQLIKSLADELRR